MTKKKYFLYLFGFLSFLFLCTGCFHTSLKFVEDTEMEEVIAEVKQEYTDIAQQYPTVVSTINQIVITEEDVGEKSGLGQPGITYQGLTDPETKRIYIQAQEWTSGILWHEFYHIVDFADATTPISHSEEYREIVDANLDEIRELFPIPYETSSYQEVFVTLMMDERMGGEKIEEMPEVQAFVEDVERGLR